MGKGKIITVPSDRPSDTTRDLDDENTVTVGDQAEEHSMGDTIVVRSATMKFLISPKSLQPDLPITDEDDLNTAMSPPLVTRN